MTQTPRRATTDTSGPSSGRVLLISLAGLLAVVLVVVGAIGIYLNAIRKSFDDNVQRVEGLVTPTPKEPGDTLNYLLMGTDSRDVETDRGRSDALMLVHVSGDRDAVYIVSYPRDMWVPIPDHGTAKINAAYAYGGMALTVRTMEELNQVPIDHVALTNFEGFKDMTASLGGVTVDNPHPSTSGGFDFPTGQITVEGDQALAYVRERYDLPGGDFDRAERQRLVVQAVLKKALSAEVLANPGRFTDFVSSFSRYLTVDAALTDTELLSTAMSMRNLRGEDIYVLQAPVSGTGTSSDGQSIDIVDQEKLAELQRALQEDTMDQYRAKYPEG